MAKRDIVYFLKDELPLDGRELRYSLRSLKNIPHGRVFMLAPDVPEWVENVTWINWEQQDEKQFDLSSKYKALPRMDEKLDMTDEVIVFDDDMYVVQKVNEAPLSYNMPLIARCKSRTRRDDDKLGASLRNTYNLLMHHEVGVPLAAHLHSPFPFTRSEMPLHLDMGEVYEWKTIWLNWAMAKLGHKGYSHLVDSKVIAPEDITKVITYDTRFMSSLDRTFEQIGVEGYLRLKYGLTKECEYEQPGSSTGDV